MVSLILQSIVMGIMIQSPPLLCAILTFFAFGGAYSIDFPFLRWKSNAILAAICIMGARAFSIQICVFLHIQRYVLGKPMAFTRSSVLATVFMCMFAVVVSVLKDIPDMDGDEAFGTKSLAILLGKEKAFWFGSSLLMMTYGVAMGVGASSPLMYSKLVTVLGHGILASILWLRAKSVNISDHEAVSAFYRFVWKVNRKR
ncbi:hypothetical protein IFM89_032463 [Coptis chinensis]|uniref:Homogentisate geranylgeranyl transferase n=1 Tax=Coptis chinensis TaxID=261450 RepID=A0A835I7N6_9MAGN|nr:hypothetical protein IFM89_032463 [Coptis chinensis]